MSPLVEKMAEAMMVENWEGATMYDLARAALMVMKGFEPADDIIDRFDTDNCHMSTYHCISQSWDMMIDAALSESA